MFRPALRSSVSPIQLPQSTHRKLNEKIQATLLRSSSSRLTLTRTLLTQETRSLIQKAVTSSPVVLFMKGTPAEPQCGFSRAVVQVLDLHNVPEEKMKTFNVLADQELRNGIKEFS